MQKSQIKLLLLAAFIFIGGFGFVDSARATHQCMYSSVKHYSGPDCDGSVLWEEKNVCGDMSMTGCGAGCSYVSEDGPGGLSSQTHLFSDFTIKSPSCGHSPIANAGPDRNILDLGNDGSESVTLDASGSLGIKGFDYITNFRWSEGGAVLGEGTSPVLEVVLLVGVHDITLTITDRGPPITTATDTVRITVSAIQEGGLVPCGRAQDVGTPNENCNFCHFFYLLRNIMNWIVLGIAPVIAVLLVAFGGFVLATSRGNPGQSQKGRDILIWTFAGLAVMFVGWLVVNTLFTEIGIVEWTGLREGWWKFSCGI